MRKVWLASLVIMSHVGGNSYLCGSHVRHKALCVRTLVQEPAHLHTDSCCGFTIRPQCSVWAGSLSHFMCVVRADNCDTWECLFCLFLFDQLLECKRESKLCGSKHPRLSTRSPRSRSSSSSAADIVQNTTADLKLHKTSAVFSEGAGVADKCSACSHELLSRHVSWPALYSSTLHQSPGS